MYIVYPVLMINDAHNIFEEQKTFYCIQITTDFERYKKKAKLNLIMFVINDIVKLKAS